MSDVTRMPKRCGQCQEPFTDERPLWVWMAHYGDDEAVAWHEKCTPEGIKAALEAERDL